MAVLIFKTGGNPPKPPRLYRGAKLVAEIPAGYELTPVTAVQLYDEHVRRDRVLTRDEARAILVEGPS